MTFFNTLICVALNCRIISELYTGKEVEGNFNVLSHISLEGLRKTMKTITIAVHGNEI
jgi:hypothetical protein